MADIDFAQAFRSMIATKLRQSLQTVKASPQHLPAEIRDQALHILSFGLKEEALTVDGNWPNTRDLLLELAPRMELMGHRTDWIPFLERGIEETKKQGQIDFLAEFQLQLALIHRLSNQLDLARQLAQCSAVNFFSVSQNHNQARALTELAWIAHEQKCYQEAQQSVQSAIALLDRNDREDALELGVCYRVLGAIALEQQKYEEAERNHRKALTIFQQHNDYRRIAWSLHNLGLVLSRQQKYQDAIPYYEQAATYLSQLRDQYHLAHIRFNAGIAYMESQQVPSAISCFKEAAIIYDQMGDKFRLSRIQTDLGLAWMTQGENHLSALSFQISMNAAREIGDDSWRLNAMDGLAMAFMYEKRFAEAIEILKEAIRSLPLIQNAKNYDYLKHSLLNHLQEATRNVKCIDKTCY